LIHHLPPAESAVYLSDQGDRMGTHRVRLSVEGLEARETPAALADVYAQTQANAALVRTLSSDFDWMANPSFRPVVEQFAKNLYVQSANALAIMTGPGTAGPRAVAAANAAAALNIAHWLGFNVLPDTTRPTVKINQGTSQFDPTNSSPVKFDVVFSERVNGFTASDVSFTGSTVGGTLVGSVSGTGARYTVSVTGMTGEGTVVASIAAGKASDRAGNTNRASSSTDNVVTFTSVAPTDAGMTSTLPDKDAPEWVAQPSGLKTWDVTVGQGDPVQAGDSIRVFYTGWLLNGTIFDSKRSPAAPADFALNNLIAGWKQGIPGMKPGGIRRLYVPSALAYGANGSPPNVPGNSDLIFEIKVVSHT
jgi:FKBP-type peptidyl-prolyl cis-trans isomerase